MSELQFFVRVTPGVVSVLLQQRYDILCTSGFVRLILPPCD